MKRSKHGLLVFPPKKTLLRRGYCSIGQWCCSMTSKQNIYWFLEVLGHDFFSPERSLNQPKTTRVCQIRSINQSNPTISVRLLFLFCSRVFILRSYENHSNELCQKLCQQNNVSKPSRDHPLTLPSPCTASSQPLTNEPKIQGKGLINALSLGTYWSMAGIVFGITTPFKSGCQ